MSKPKKRGKALKIQEFYAHSEAVNSACLGKNSSHVLATGGDDFRVNIWKLGKHKPLMSFVGHQTEVDCVMFDSPEEIVAAGSRGGSIKLWDLAHEKLLRTVGGHRSSIRCLDFHPYGDFFASGSLDTNVKVWDIRKKGCMHTYKGHNGAVTTVKHSPDGRWIVSGDVDGVVKVWDLTAGKLETEFKGSAADAITCLDFHPNEFLLAVGSADRTVNLWDMEAFEVVSSTSKETNPIKATIFSRDGSALLCASSDSLKSWGWEPVRCYDSIDVQWNNLADVSISEADELIGVSHNKTIVSIFLVDLPQIAPFSHSTEDGIDICVGEETSVTNSPLARKDSVPVPSRNPNVTPNPKLKNHSAGDATQLLPTSTLIHSSARDKQTTPEGSPANARESSESSHGKAVPSPSVSRYHSLIQQHKREYKKKLQQGLVTAPPSIVVSGAELSIHDVGHTLRPSSNMEVGHMPVNNAYEKVRQSSAESSRIETSEPGQLNYPPRPVVHSPVAKPESQKKTPSPRRSQSQTDVRPMESKRSAASGQPREQSSNSEFTTDLKNMTLIPNSSERSAPLGLNVNAFLSNNTPAPSVNDMDQEAIREKICKENPLMLQILNQRLQNLRVLKHFWRQGNIKGAMQALMKMNDLPVAVDFFNGIESHLISGNVMTLEIAAAMLPVIKSLLGSRFEGYVSISLRYLKVQLRSFSQLILDTRSAPSNFINPSQEERLERCNECYDQYKAIYPLVQNIAKKKHEVGHLARDVDALLSKLLQGSI